MNLVKDEIGNHIDGVEKWNPLQSDAVQSFTYIDLSSVDKEKKQIDETQTQLILCGEAPSRARQKVKSFDILVATVRPNLNGVAIVPLQLDDATASTGYCVLRPNEKTLSSRYLFFWVQTKYFINDMMSKATGANYPAVSDKTIKQSKIPLPPIAEQQKIAEILDAADALRQKDQQLIDHYTELSQSLFLDMFGDPVANTLSWGKIKLESLAKINSGSTPSRDKQENYVGNIPWVKTTEVKGVIITQTIECISEEALKTSSCRLNPAGSLIIAMYGQGKTRGQIGKLGISAATNQACAVIPPSDLMNYDYLFSLLRLLYDDLRSLGRGGNQPNLNCGLIKSYSVISPPIKLQKQFADRIAIIEKQKQQAQASLEQSNNLFSSLLQKAFTGELTQH